MAKMGRPRKEIDKRDFEKLCMLQCTRAEMCSWFNVSEPTLIDWCKRTHPLDAAKKKYHQMVDELTSV